MRDGDLRWYPRAWRDRYGEELAALLEDQYGRRRLPLRVTASLAGAGLRQRARYSGLTGDRATAPDRIRAGTLTVLAAWTALVVAGASFAKLSEHFDDSLPPTAGAHRLPDDAFSVIQDGASGAALVVLAGLAVALPALVRFLRSGGWPALRGHVLRAAGAAVGTVAVTVPLLVWAHHLSSQQRNGGLSGYGALFLVWAALVVADLVLWTVVAVAAGRRVSFTPTELAIESGLAVAVAAAVTVILAATAVWWATVASRAPGFITDGGRVPVTAQLVATVALMVVAAGAAIAGSARIVRSWPASRRGGGLAQPA